MGSYSIVHRDNFNFKMICLVLLVGVLIPGCDKKSETIAAHEQQSQTQAYPILLAASQAADYGVPFCEQKFCNDIEIQTLNSSDPWFDQTVAAIISDIIRQQLNINQKLNLQQAVDAFVLASDQAQSAAQPHQTIKPWGLHIDAQLAAQQQQLALVMITANFAMPIPNQTIHTITRQNIQYSPARKPLNAPQRYFKVLDRKAQRMVQLYDVIAADKRLEFNQLLQQHYQLWRTKLDTEQQTRLPEKIYWANQDWFFDEQGIGIVYRASDWGVDAADLSINLTTAQTHHYLAASWLKQLQLR